MAHRITTLLQPPPTTPVPRPGTSTVPVTPPSTTATPTPTGTPDTSAATGLSGASTWVVLLLTLALFVAAVWPLVQDARRANEWRSSVTQWLTTQKLSSQDLRLALRTVSRPHGTQGLTRSLIATLIIALAGAALIVTLLSDKDDMDDLRKTAVTALFTVLATVAGFYFGARTAETQASSASGTESGGETAAPAATISSVKPVPGTPTSVRVTGTGLQGAMILFGGVPSPGVTATSDTEVTAQLPQRPTSSVRQVTVVAVNERGASAPASYTYP